MKIDSSKPHAVFLDIDGTLMGHGHFNSLCEGEMSARTVEAIKQAQKRGHKILINTGRGEACLPHSVKRLGFDGLLTGLGSLIVLGEKTVFSCPLHDDMLKEIVGISVSENKAIRLTGKQKCFAYDPDKKYCEHWRHFSSVSEFFEIKGDEPVFKVSFDILDSLELLNYLQRYCNLYLHPPGGEAASKGINKANAMKIALDILGIPRERSIAMGDSVNDMEMLLNAGVPIAMGNSEEKVKRVCEHITDSFSDDGVAKAIEFLLL